MFSGKVPIEIKKIDTLNPRDVVYLNFASLDEASVSYQSGKRTYGIQVYFPINPLSSNKSNWLNHEPYELELTATAAESLPFAVKCKLWVEAGRLKLTAFDT